MVTCSKVKSSSAGTTTSAATPKPPPGTILYPLSTATGLVGLNCSHISPPPIGSQVISATHPGLVKELSEIKLQVNAPVGCVEVIGLVIVLFVKVVISGDDLSGP